MNKTLKYALKYNNHKNYDLNKLVARLIKLVFIITLFHISINKFFDINLIISILILSVTNTIIYSVKKYILNK